DGVVEMDAVYPGVALPGLVGYSRGPGLHTPDPLDQPVRRARARARAVRWDFGFSWREWGGVMRKLLLGLVVLVGWLAAGAGARAGVYNLASLKVYDGDFQESLFFPAPDQLRNWLGEMRAVALEGSPQGRQQPVAPGSLRDA